MNDMKGSRNCLGGGCFCLFWKKEVEKILSVADASWLHLLWARDTCTSQWRQWKGWEEERLKG